MKEGESNEYPSDDDVRELLLKGERNLENALELIKLLSNPTRFKMAYLLCKRELCTNDLERILGVEQTLVSHHLRAFKEMNLTKERREGRWRFYSIGDRKIQDFFRAIRIPGME